MTTTINWISTKERLPKEDGTYLCVFKSKTEDHGMIITAWYCANDETFEDQAWWSKDWIPYWAESPKIDCGEEDQHGD